MKLSAKILRKTLNYALCIVHCALFASCNTDELCYHHPHDGDFHVRFDWSDCPDSRPESMRIWFYRASGGEGSPYDYGLDGGLVQLFPYSYHMIAHNSDTEWITWNNTWNHEEHVATTRNAHILEPMQNGYTRATDESQDELLPVPGERVVVAPEPLYIGSIKDHQVVKDETVTIKLSYPICHYTIDFININNSQHIANVSAAISGLSDGILLHSGEKTSAVCTITIPVSISRDGKTISGSFYTFGHRDDIDTKHRVGLYVMMDDGKKYKYLEGDYLDVTPQIHNAPNPKEVHIVIDGLQLPEVISNGSGFSVGLDDWNDEHHDIEI